VRGENDGLSRIPANPRTGNCDAIAEGLGKKIKLILKYEYEYLYS
jgi:hypothetical protein